MYIEMELSRVLIAEFTGDQLIFLREKNGQRTFPIVIGMNEAMAIHRRLNDEKTPRPMTHDLLAAVMGALGGRLEALDTLTSSMSDLKGTTDDQANGIESADMAQVAVDLATTQTLYQMSLATAAKLLSTSLLDYI